jgi:beta-glucosidase
VIVSLFGRRSTCLGPSRITDTASACTPPGRANFDDFLKAAHTASIAQGEAFRALNAHSSKATVGTAYSMGPGYPKTESDAHRAATARYHAMNNLYFLNAAMRGEYPKAFVGEPPYEAMGFKPGDEKIMKVPLDWVGFHYYTRRVVSDPSGSAHAGGPPSFGTETESDTTGCWGENANPSQST